MGPERAIRVLFICHYNRKRSATAERIFGKDPGLDVRSAGTSSEAMVQVNERMLDWADIVFVMDDEQAAALGHSFPTHPGAKNAVILHIKDDYHFLDPELVQLLRERATPHLDRLRAAAGRSQSPKPN
jgi:protein-tyrosine phosphatase